MIALIKGRHYLIRQRWKYGTEYHDDIAVVKLLSKASKHVCEDYLTDYGETWWGQNVKNDEKQIFTWRDVISTIKI